MHRDAADEVDRAGVPKDLWEAQRAMWDLTLESGRQHGYRNAQATVLAPDRDDRLHDGLRHDGRRAGPRAREVQEARRRRDDQDRQPDGPPRAHAPRLLGRGDARDREVHRREGHDRGRPRPQGRAPAGLRLRLQGPRRHALDRPDGARAHDVGRPALPLGRDQQDGQHAERRDGRGDRRRLHAGLEARDSRRSRFTATAASGPSPSTRRRPRATTA